MTSLSKPREPVTRGQPSLTAIDFESEDIKEHATTSSTNVNEVKVLDKSYFFSDEMITAHPKLLDPSTRFSLNFDDVLPILYEYSPSCLNSELMSDYARKQVFLSNIEWLDIQLSDSVILHLCQNTKRDLQECADFVSKQAGKKGEKKLRFCLRRDVAEFAESFAEMFRRELAEIQPIDIIRYLEMGLVDKLTILDFKSKNLVSPLIDKFMELFLSKGT